MRALVIGFGSIGRRHFEVLQQLGLQCFVVSRHAEGGGDFYRSVPEALSHVSPDYIVVANETSAHFDTLCELSQYGYTGYVLIEKPLFDRLTPVVPHKFKGLYVGYNLRFHPILLRLQKLLGSTRFLSMQAYVGQYLPTWRPGVDYRTSYSAKAEQGGGVLRDLSHELDYVNWLTEGWTAVVAQGGHTSTLEISSDDNYSILVKAQQCKNALIHLNYLDRDTRREIIINTDDATIKADLVNGLLTVNGIMERFICERNHTYLSMHRAILENEGNAACTFQQGMEVMAMIVATDKSNAEHRWVWRSELL